MNKSADSLLKNDMLVIAEIYERLYHQFVDLMNFSYKLAGSYRKSDAVAAIISEEVTRIDGVKNNAVWIVIAPDRIGKMAQNGAMLHDTGREIVTWNENDELSELIKRQRVAWGPFTGKTREILRGFQSPLVFPIRGIKSAQGLLVVDHAEKVDTERCQYITKFSSMILEMSTLYFRLEDEIKERRLLEELLIRERNKAQSYLNVAEVMIVGLDRDGKVDLINRKGCQILGYPAEEVVGKNWFDNFVDKNGEGARTSFHSQILENNLDTGKFFEGSVVNSSGELRHIQWRNNRVLDEDGQVVGTISCGTDITDQKKSELEKQAIQEQLFQSQKMEAIGTLVGGIAHDFNNMLQAIMGYSELLLDDIAPGKPGHYEMKTVIQTAKGGAELVRKLMAFSQQAVTFPTNFDLNHQIRELAILLTRTLPQEVRVVLNLCDGESVVNADPNQIDQCVMNLAINGAEAMSAGGVLTIETKNVDLTPEFCSLNPGMEPGRRLALIISDTGRGMDEKTISRIYEPFFSTKQRGALRGTGLGLSVVKGILDRHDIVIKCESKLGKGTSFTIYFPAAGGENMNTSSHDLPVVFNSQ